MVLEPMAETDRERWNTKYAGGGGPGAPSPSLVELAAWLPSRGRALDLAGGAGANALWLAQRGLTVTLVDVADAGLALARARADAAGVALELRRADLEVDALPEGPWELITCSHYLQLDLIVRAAAALAPGGRLIWIHPTTTNLERHPKPSARFLLAPGQAQAVILDAAPALGLELELSEEGWVGEGTSARHLARVVARRRLDGDDAHS